MEQKQIGRPKTIRYLRVTVKPFYMIKPDHDYNYYDVDIEVGSSTDKYHTYRHVIPVDDFKTRLGMYLDEAEREIIDAIKRIEEAE